MKYANLRYGEERILEVTTGDMSSFDNVDSNTPIFITYSEKLKSYAIKISKKAASLVKPKDKRNNNLLSELISTGLPFLASISNKIKDNTTNNLHLMIAYRIFDKEMNFDDKVSIEVDDKIFNDIKSKYLIKDKSQDACYQFLQNEFFLKKLDDEKNYIFLSTGVDLDRKEDNEKDESFRLYGNKIVADVKNVKGKLILNRIVHNTYSVNNSKNIKVFIGVCNLEFTDSADEIRKNSKKQLKELSEKGSSILGSWKKYNKIEYDIMNERIQKIGCFQYEIFWVEDERYFCRLKDEKDVGKKLKATYEYLKDFSNNNIELSISQGVPEYITTQLSLINEPESANTLNIQKVNIDLTNLTIEFSLDDNKDDTIPENGFIFYPYHGDLIQIERKAEAQKKIFSSNNPMPQLASLLENISTEPRRGKKLKAMSPKLRKKMESRTPTKAQLEAIEVALNTPDIAVIQGPPGTGKTTVITSIIERLAEEVEKNENYNDLILVSSFQHDAVENATDRIEINGIPAIKLGKKMKMIDSARKTAEKWKEKQEKKINEKLLTLPVSKIYKELRKKVNLYIQTPGNAIETVALLKSIRETIKGENLISINLLNKLNTEIATIENESKTKSVKDSLLIKLIRGLRTNEPAFLDDGLMKSYNLLEYLKKKGINLSSQEEQILEKSSSYHSSTPPDFLKELEVLKDKLLDKWIPAKKLSLEYMENRNISALLTDILDEAHQKLLKSKVGHFAVLSEYLDDISSDPDGVVDMLAHYTSVLAASCQQAASKRMLNIKKKDLIYDTVIIDEAARAAPLDLLIPMSQAKRRIILVGDHRQLPHMVEEDIIKKMEQEVNKTAENDIDIEGTLKESLFEKLFRNLNELEKKTGIKRCVTLDKQFRTTPVLGNFVSKHFYECHNEPHIESGMPIEKLQHGLKNYQDKSAAWLDVPLSAGKEQSGQSKSRRSEAKVIAQEIKNLIEEKPELTYGIITFYAAQRELIKTQIEQSGVDLKALEKNDRLRIGSIDAFQGREFDVVLLSITRSNDTPASTEKQWRKKYGFMIFANRLCVAMSRQKRLLVVVGDPQMFEIEGAEKAIPQMCEFRKLCKTDDGVIRKYEEII